jgi:hypothetical protein
MRDPNIRLQRFGVLGWETQFAFWHTVFMFWWILLIVLIQKSPEAHVDYRQALGRGFADIPDFAGLSLTLDFLCSLVYHAVFVSCLLIGDARFVSVSKLLSASTDPYTF